MRPLLDVASNVNVPYRALTGEWETCNNRLVVTFCDIYVNPKDCMQSGSYRGYDANITFWQVLTG